MGLYQDPILVLKTNFSSTPTATQQVQHNFKICIPVRKSHTWRQGPLQKTETYLSIISLSPFFFLKEWVKMKKIKFRLEVLIWA